MREYLESTWTRVGLGLLIVGTGPLLLVILAATLGLSSDRNPNPVGLGLLSAATLWPALICIVVGVMRVRRQRAS